MNPQDVVILAVSVAIVFTTAILTTGAIIKTVIDDRKAMLPVTAAVFSLRDSA